MSKKNSNDKQISDADLAIWRDYIETAEALKSQLESRLQASSKLSMADYAVLLALVEAENRQMRPSELAAHISWDRSRLSHHVGRMQKRGLVERVACPDDNRGFYIVLKDEGCEALREASGPHLRAVKELFLDAFSATQLHDIGLMGTSLRQHLQLD